jgi:hypothetical protein
MLLQHGSLLAGPLVHAKPGRVPIVYDPGAWVEQEMKHPQHVAFSGIIGADQGVHFSNLKRNVSAGVEVHYAKPCKRH